jgi:hypothetical protein
MFMARKDDEKKLVYMIPKNFEEKSVTTNGLNYRNIAEAVFLVGIVVIILWKIDISLKTKLITGILVGGPLGVLALIGINKCSLSEFLINIVKFKMKPKVYVKKNIFQKK